MGVSGFRKKSLDKSGAIAGFAVGAVSLGLSLRLGLTLILFYKSSSVLTKVGFDRKSKATADYKARQERNPPGEGGQRNAVQVLSCSLFATILAVIHFFLVGVGDSLVDFRVQPWGATLLCAYLGFYACCAGDTWSSELGVLSSRPPRLVTSPWRVVPRGTNGGISLEGTAASAVAGGVMGTGFVFLGWMFRLAPPPTSSSASQMPLILLGMASGVVGSVVDSFMGAVLQASYFDRNRKVIVEKPSPAELAGGHLELLCGRDILSNEQINMISVSKGG
ncbi:unnamed protein product [Ascophyllum nodosum]